MIHVIFPAFNEERVIRPTLVRLHEAMAPTGLPYRAILVDDGSTDATVAQAEAAVIETGGALELTVLPHATNQGLGAGLRTGIDWCLANGSGDDVVVTLDADGTHPPAQIPSMLERLGPGVDVVIASRYRPGARVFGVPPARRALSEVSRLVFQALFPIPGVRDYTCAFRVTRLSTLRKARLVYGDELTTARGFEAVMDLLLRLRQLGIRAREVPLDLDYSDRVGRSKMHVFRTIRRTLALLARRFVEQFTTWSRSRVRARLAEAEAVQAAQSAGTLPDTRVHERERAA